MYINHLAFHILQSSLIAFPAAYTSRPPSYDCKSSENSANTHILCESMRENLFISIFLNLLFKLNSNFSHNSLDQKGHFTYDAHCLMS